MPRPVATPPPGAILGGEWEVAPPPERPIARFRRRSFLGLDLFNFFIANLQTGFGPFVAIYLTSERWTQVDIGIVLTVGGVLGLLGQAPAGLVVDAVRSKRMVAAVSVALVGLSALGLALNSHFSVILLAWALHALASCAIGPTIASLSLGLVGHTRLSRRLGRNASFQSLGAAAAAGGMGAIGSLVSHQAVFLVTAALAVPALAALVLVPARGRAASPGAEDRSGPARSEAAPGGTRALLTDRRLVMLAVCVILFHLANAALLPILGSLMTRRSSESASMLIAACLIVPQVVVAFLSPLVGARAESWGRRPLLLLAFAALAVRGLVFGLADDVEILVAAQLLDGLSAASLGVLVPLMVADITRAGGHYALAQGMIGTAMGIGASLSTMLGGLLADRLGSASAFLALGTLAFAGAIVAMMWMPETGPARDAGPRGSPR